MTIEAPLLSSQENLSLEPLHTPQLYERILERLKAQIAEGVLRPGDRLPSERELARMLRVSRPVVREAIGALQNEQLVWTRPGAGTFVADSAPSRLREDGELRRREPDASPIALLEVRAILEPAAAELAARRGHPGDTMRTLLAQADAVVDLSDLVQRTIWSDSDRLFHREVAVMTENPVLGHIADYVAEAMAQPLWQVLRDEALVDVQRIKLYSAEHRMIFDAVSRGDGEGAAFIAAQHIRRVRADMSLE